MRFTNGFWLMRPGVQAHYAREAYDLEATDDALVVTAPTKPITTRGDTLSLPVLTVTVAPHLPGVIRARKLPSAADCTCFNNVAVPALKIAIVASAIGPPSVLTIPLMTAAPLVCAVAGTTPASSIASIGITAKAVRSMNF